MDSAGVGRKVLRPFAEKSDGRRVETSQVKSGRSRAIGAPKSDQTYPSSPSQDSAGGQSGGENPAITVPAGAPAWVTAEFIAKTIRVWQPYYEQNLTPGEAIDIIRNVSRLGDILSEP